MADVGGTLTFDDLAPTGLLPTEMPSFVPQVDGSAVTELDKGLSWPAYAVSLRRVFSPKSATIYPRFRDSDARQVLGLRPGQLVVLCGHGEDPLVEAFWTVRHRDGLIGQIARQGWDVVLAPNYSIYGNWPRTEHLLNMRRALLVCSEMCDAGVTAVPNLYWFRLEDLKRYADWLADVRPPAVAVNLQTVRQNKSWPTWAVPGLVWLGENLPPDLPVILNGLSRADRIATAVEIFGQRLVVISQNPHQYALHGAVMTATGRQDLHAHVEDAFRSSVRYMSGLLPQASGV